MDNGNLKEHLNQALGEMPYLRTLGYGNHTLDEWKNKIGRILQDTYGTDSPEYRRFNGAAGTAFVVGTELGQQQEYHRRLDCYEDVLKEMAGK